jgi:hypothetical protein
MGHAEATAKMNVVHMAKFGQPVVYIPPDGQAVETKGIFTDGAMPETDMWPNQPAQSDAATVVVLSDAVETPEYQAKVVFEGETWTVRRGWKRLTGAWELPLTRDVRPIRK